MRAILTRLQLTCSAWIKRTQTAVAHSESICSTTPNAMQFYLLLFGGLDTTADVPRCFARKCRLGHCFDGGKIMGVAISFSCLSHRFVSEEPCCGGFESSSLGPWAVEPERKPHIVFIVPRGRVGGRENRLDAIKPMKAFFLQIEEPEAYSIWLYEF
jgi:hypothetical protein